MTRSKYERHNPALLDLRRPLLLAVVVLMVFFVFAVTFILAGTERWGTLGFKIFELSTQMVLVTVLGGVLVHAYIKWHSRESSMNEFRKDTAEVVIREYSAVKKVRRLLRANCISVLFRLITSADLGIKFAICWIRLSRWASARIA